MAKRYLWHDYLFEDVVKTQKPTGPMSNRKRTDPVPRWWAKRLSEMGNTAQRKQRKARQRKALADSVERQKGRRPQYQTKVPHRLVDKVMRLMEAGNWYGLKALCRAAGLDRSQSGRVQQVLLGNAWATRLKNPEWDPAWHGRVKPGTKDVEPEWLYKLTEDGEAEKKRVALISPCG